MRYGSWFQVELDGRVHPEVCHWFNKLWTDKDPPLLIKDMPEGHLQKLTYLQEPKRGYMTLEATESGDPIPLHLTFNGKKYELVEEE